MEKHVGNENEIKVERVCGGMNDYCCQMRVTKCAHGSASV